MNSGEQIHDMLKATELYYKKEQGWLYPDDIGQCGVYQSILKRVNKTLQTPDKYFMTSDRLKALSQWNLDYSQYACAHLDSKNIQKSAFAESAWCGYLAVKLKGEFNRFRRPDFFLSGDVLLIWANCCLSGWFDEANEIGGLCLKTPEKGGGVIKDGYSFDTASFFLLELHCLWQDISFNREAFDHPLFDGEDTLFIYDDILKNWKTTDLAQVDEYVSQMSDYHLSQTLEVQDPDEDYYEFNNTYNQLYPYEIMAWLKLREHIGLPNPTKFSHPLMNQPLAEFIEGTPLNKPEMEQVNELLDIVRKALPEAEV